MSFVKAVALAIREDEQLNGVWPDGGTHIDHDGNYEVTIHGAKYTAKNWRGEDQIYERSINIEGYGLPYIEEYCEGESITREEYEEFVAQNPNFYEDVQKAKQVNVGKIAELNKQVGALINEITQLAEEAAVDVYINLGQHGGLDVNSDWNSSRC